MAYPIPDFVPFPKIPRHNRGIVITEKIDGTNAGIYVPEDPAAPLLAASRNRWLLPGQADNFDFGMWVATYSDLLRGLGPGTHWGEWYGRGIGRNYGLQERRFALFNTSRWAEGRAPRPSCCGVVPTLYAGDFAKWTQEETLRDLRENGSKAVSGFMKPEGIVIYHTAAKIYTKVTLEKDDAPKSLETQDAV